MLKVFLVGIILAGALALPILSFSLWQARLPDEVVFSPIVAAAKAVSVFLPVLSLLVIAVMCWRATAAMPAPQRLAWCGVVALFQSAVVIACVGAGWLSPERGRTSWSLSERSPDGARTAYAEPAENWLELLLLIPGARTRKDVTVFVQEGWAPTMREAAHERTESTRSRVALRWAADSSRVEVEFIPSAH